METKIVITGGSGFLATILARHFKRKNNKVILLSRTPLQNQEDLTYQYWDGKNPGPWCKSLENADTVINLAGKSVDCRYHGKNKKAIIESRINSTKAIGMAIASCKNPPKRWFNASSATIYRHSLDKAMSEVNGDIGNGFSENVCQKWEACCLAFDTPKTQKIILRMSLVLGKNGGVYPVLKRLVEAGLGGKAGKGNQYVSWIHEDDFLKAIEFLMSTNSFDGIFNITAPNPIENLSFMGMFRKSHRINFGIPQSKFLLEIGAFFLRTETELLLKSRRVIPEKLERIGFKFKYNNPLQALQALAK